MTGERSRITALRFPIAGIRSRIIGEPTRNTGDRIPVLRIRS